MRNTFNHFDGRGDFELADEFSWRPSKVLTGVCNEKFPLSTVGAFSFDAGVGGKLEKRRESKKCSWKAFHPRLEMEQRSLFGDAKARRCAYVSCHFHCFEFSCST